jgi:antitoxin component YwqK of YwqJK toxin-antitoxin module
MKKFLSGMFLLIGSTCFAQKQNVYFFKNNGIEVTVRDSADYIRVVREPDSGMVNYKVTEVYKNGKPKLVGESSTVEPLTREGTEISYDPTGKKHAITEFKNGKAISQHQYTYYPNGKLQAVLDYPDLSNQNPFEDYLLLTYSDTTGKALITNGEGYFAGNDILVKERYNEGKIASGKKDGEWKGTYADDKVTFIENYKDGRLLSGTCITSEGKTYTYNTQNKLPSFNIKGNNSPSPVNFGEGFAVRRSYTSSVTAIPVGSPRPAYGTNQSGGVPASQAAPPSDSEYRSQREAAENEASWNKKPGGRVLITFIIDKKGVARDFKVSQSLGENNDQAALRLISDNFRRNKNINPRIYYGRPVDTKYTVPVVFN